MRKPKAPPAVVVKAEENWDYYAGLQGVGDVGTGPNSRTEQSDVAAQQSDLKWGQSFLSYTL